MKTDKEKAEEILKERERARKGIAVTNDEGKDPLKKYQNTVEGEEDREEKIADAGLAVGLGLKRSG
jgi:hypothetical protein